MKYMYHVFFALLAASASFAAEVKLSTLTDHYKALDGDVLTGTLAGNYKISIADGATVTLKNVAINGTNEKVCNDGSKDISCKWAGLTCLGYCTIVLEGSNTVTGFDDNYPGIQAAKNEGVGREYMLTIEGEGSLEASSNGHGAGIGGGFGMNCGDITISGGNITATGGDGGAGIGGASDELIKKTCGDITITGGVVTAMGGGGAAGIGSGIVAISGDITIRGGEVTATGGASAAGIGSGFNGTSGAITISGGKVTATGVEKSAGIGGGSYGTSGNITITKGVAKVVATKGEDATYSINVGKGAGKVTIGGVEGAVEKSPYVFIPGLVDLSTLTGHYEATNGDVLTGTLNGNPEHPQPYMISIDDGATVTLSDATINGNLDEDFSFPWAGLTCVGNCTIVLEGSNTVKGFHQYYPGIQAAKNEGEGEEYTLTIEGEGSLVASSNGYAAGIGGGYGQNCGNITINGGEIVATGGYGSAGIGGGYGQNCGDITISGGEVTATGGQYAAGIGSGENGKSGDITISGGTVTATGDEFAAGIGSGENGKSGDITISGGKVTTTGGQYAAGIGGGLDGTCGNIAIKGGTVTATGGDKAAGIGSGDEGTSGDVTISDGTVTATGGAWAAGIGVGYAGHVEAITINGGEVAAIGGNNGAGIGVGFEGACGNITITNDVTKVVAVKGAGAPYSIGGYDDETGSIDIGGKTKSPIEKGFFIFPAPPAKLVDFETVGGKTYAVIDGDYSGDDALNIVKDVGVDKVVFERTFPSFDGEKNYATIMFPFAISADKVGGVKKVFSFVCIGIDFFNRKYVAVEKVDKFEAYKPYLIQLKSEGDISINNTEPLVLKKTPTKSSAFEVAQSSDYNKYGDYVFRGVVQGKTWGAEDDDVLGTDGAAAYGFASAATKDVEVGQFVKVGDGASIKPFRGYIYKKPVPKKVKSNGDYVLRQTASIEELPDVMDIVVVDRKKDGSKQTTVIGQFNSRTGEIRMNRTERTYDLKGRSVRDANRMAKGVYLKK